MSPRNADWTHDELVLALELYRRLGDHHYSPEDPEIIKLSRFLRAHPVNPAPSRTRSFRNPNGVAKKLYNLARFATPPRPNLPSGSALDEVVWREFQQRTTSELEAAAAAIRAYAIELSRAEALLLADDLGFHETGVRERLHRVRERHRGLVRRKKASVHELRCEACRRTMEEIYGQAGEGTIECHHRVPLEDLAPGQVTRLVDLALVCPNCHRVLHRSRLTVEGLGAQLRNRMETLASRTQASHAAY